MKKRVSLLGTIGLSFLLTTNAFAATTFTDLEGSYAKTEITKLAEMGIVNGYEDGTFKPTKKITRDEFAKILCDAMELEKDSNTAAQFTDVEEWARGYVGALVKEGITAGTSATTYGGLEELTREQMTSLLVRSIGMEEVAQGLYDEGTIKNTFEDEALISDYAKADVAFAQAIGLVKGDGTNFDPQGKAERQAVARLVYELGANGETYANKVIELAGSGEAEAIQ